MNNVQEVPSICPSCGEIELTNTNITVLGVTLHALCCNACGVRIVGSEAIRMWNKSLNRLENKFEKPLGTPI